MGKGGPAINYESGPLMGTGEVILVCTMKICPFVLTFVFYIWRGYMVGI